MFWTIARSAALLALLALIVETPTLARGAGLAGQPDPAVLRVDPIRSFGQDDYTLVAASYSRPVPVVRDGQRRGTSTGSISGWLGYPSSMVPPMLVYAIRVDTASVQFVSIRTAFNQLEYTIDGLEPGVYVVLAYLESVPDFAGGYTQAVPCGLTVACTDHTLIAVTVVAGETVIG